MHLWTEPKGIHFSNYEALVRRCPVNRAPAYRMNIVNCLKCLHLNNYKALARAEELSNAWITKKPFLQLYSRETQAKNYQMS